MPAGGAEKKGAFLDRLNAVLKNFRAELLVDADGRPADITVKFAYEPHGDKASSCLGKGSYGEAFRMRSLVDNHEPLRVVKAIPKWKVSRTELQVKHLAAELAVTTSFKHQHLNRRIGLYHNDDTLYMVLEMVQGTAPDARSRLLYLFAHHAPHRLRNFDKYFADAERAATARGFAQDLNRYLDKGAMATLLTECGARREAPVSTTLHDLINASPKRRLPDGLTKVIARQALLGLQHLHEWNVVHRDVKTENLVLGIDRRCELQYAVDNDDTTRVRCVRVYERVRAKVIDFGLAKFMDVSTVPDTPSPGSFGRGAVPSLAAATSSVFAHGTADLDFGDDPFAAPPPPPPAPLVTAAAVRRQFPVTNSVIGTAVFCPMDVLKGMVAAETCISTSADLPKIDVYGVGAMLFCCANGRVPFCPPRQEAGQRPLSREERIRQVQLLVAEGLSFSHHVSKDMEQFVRLLMHNDPAQRPDTEAALAHPFLKEVRSDMFVYDVDLNGNITEVAVGDESYKQPWSQPKALSVTSLTSFEPSSPPLVPEVGSPLSSAKFFTAISCERDSDDETDNVEEDASNLALLAAVIRGQEDTGDVSCKGDFA